MIRRVLLPAARSGVVTSVILAVGRAIGETMAVALVCGNVVQMPTSLSTSIRTLTANIALEMPYSGASHRSALFVSGLLLLAVVVVLVLLAEWIGKGSDHHA
jgi:phosphate transport system permease protein